MGRKCLLSILGFCLLGVMSVFATLATDYDLTSGPKALVYDLADATLKYHSSNSDLINGIRGTLVSGGFHGATQPSDDGQRLDTLTDGIWAPNSLTVIANDYGHSSPSLEVEYSFSPSIAISEILVYSGHEGDGSRGWINVKIDVDNGAGYNTLISNLKTGPYGQVNPGQSMVAVVRAYDDAGGYVENHVERIKLGFYCVSNTFSPTPQFEAPSFDCIVGTILKEIDILATSPASVRDSWWIMY